MCSYNSGGIGIAADYMTYRILLSLLPERLRTRFFFFTTHIKLDIEGGIGIAADTSCAIQCDMSISLLTKALRCRC